MAQAKYGEAVEWYEGAIGDAKARLGERHPDVASLLDGLGWVMQHTGYSSGGARGIYEVCDASRIETIETVATLRLLCKNMSCTRYSVACARC